MFSPVPEPARQFHLPGGEQLSVRPLHRDDGARLQAYVRSLSPQARYNRFLGAVSELPQAELARMETDASATLIAETDVNGSPAIVGEARYAIATDGRGGEFAVSVAEAWRGKGSRRCFSTRSSAARAIREFQFSSATSCAPIRACSRWHGIAGSG